MSDSPSSSIPTWNVYIQDEGGYVGKHLVEAIRERSAHWDGGAEAPASSDDDPTTITRRLVVINSEGKTTEDCIDQADLIVVNAFHDVESAISLVKFIRSARLSRAKTLVCLSTVLTWGGSTFNEDTTANEQSFRSRIPMSAVVRHKLLETLTINSSRDLLSTFVIASGVLYGDGEMEFHSLFRQAWLGDNPSLPIYGSGANIIPTIHVKDLATIFVRYCERPQTQSPYIIAVDKSRSTQKDIVGTISSNLGSGQVAALDEAEAVNSKDSIQPHIALANIIIDQKDSFVSSLEMEWRSEQGIIPSIIAVIDQYITARNLQPLRVCLIGPPGSGKSRWALKLASHFYLPHINIKNVLTKAKDAGTDLQLGKDGRAPIEVVAGLVRSELGRNEVLNKGYILDGYPRSLEEAKALFEVQEQGPNGGDEESEQPQAKRSVNLKPDRVIYLTTPETLALARAKESKDTIAGHNDEKGQNRRMMVWNKLGVDNNPRTYFGALEILDMNGSDPDNTIQDAMISYVQGNNPPFNYHPTDQELAAEAAAKALDLQRQQQQHEDQRREHEAQLEKEAREHAKKAAERETLLAELAAKERVAIELRARPLRDYLSENILPFVVDGLVEIAKLHPDDPIDYLAEYLFKCSASISSKSPISAPTSSANEPIPIPTQSELSTST